MFLDRVRKGSEYHLLFHKNKKQKKKKTRDLFFPFSFDGVGCFREVDDD